MTRFLLIRAAEAVGVLLLLSFLVFLLGTLIPGDTAVVSAGVEGATAAQMEALRAQLGLDQNLIVRYWRWLAAALSGDLGVSPITGRSVTSEIGRSFPITLELAVVATVVSVALGVPLGVFAASQADRLGDRLTRAMMLGVFSVPNFVIAVFLVYLGSRHWQSIYSSSYSPISNGIISNLTSIALPALAAGLPLAAMVGQMTRASMLENLDQDFVRLAQAKGAPGWHIAFIHALKPSLAPVVTLVGLLFGSLLGGLILIEVIFNFPGLGRVIYEAIKVRDFPLVIGGSMTIAATYVLINLAVDLLYPVLDPRQRS